MSRVSRYIHVKKTKLKHYVSSAYFVQPLHVSDVFIAHHQEVHHIYVQQSVLIVLFSWLSVVLVGTDSQLKTTVSTNCLYTVSLLTMGYKYARSM